MDREVVISKLKDVFADVFDNDEIELRDDMSARDVDGWDSLANIRLLLTIEKAFAFSFDTGEISEFKNVGELIDSIIRHTVV